MKLWMKKLAEHYREMKSKFSYEKLIILFDIDGTIIDMRHLVFNALKVYDKENHTLYFVNLKIDDIKIHENQVAGFLSTLHIPKTKQSEILKWYNEYRWTEKALLDSHRPFYGVMEVIRWFQIQPDTFVGLNTGRPEILRKETLSSLNKIGKSFKVTFDNELLFMNQGNWEKNVQDAKVRAVYNLETEGYRVIAFIDNEPVNLEAIAGINNNTRNILLLHADTIFESRIKKLPSESISGSEYDITELVESSPLPEHTQFVWHGVNISKGLDRFLSSNIKWAEFSVTFRNSKKDITSGKKEFNEDYLDEGPVLLQLENITRLFIENNKGLKIDFNNGGSFIEKIIFIMKHYSFPEENLWFNAKIEIFSQEDFIKLSKTFPKSVLQCSIDFISFLIHAMPDYVFKILKKLQSWGIKRFSLGWDIPGITSLLEILEGWGMEVNIYNVPDLESFLKAVLLQPASITSNFNFHQWIHNKSEKNLKNGLLHMNLDK